MRYHTDGYASSRAMSWEQNLWWGWEPKEEIGKHLFRTLKSQ